MGKVRRPQTWKFVLLNKTSVHTYKGNSNENLKNVEKKKNPLCAAAGTGNYRYGLEACTVYGRYVEKCHCCT
jgi:hypothetical protein